MDAGLTRDILTLIIAPIVTALIAGVGFLVKHWLNQAEKKRQAEIAERNERRDKIEQKQDEMEQDLNTLLAMLSSCDKQDCKVRPLVVNYLLERAKKKNVINNLN